VKYATAAAFRSALEDRINRQTGGNNESSVRLRKMIVFDRFLARLLVVAPEQWIVKGGFALNIRIGDRARVTRDLDLAHQGSDEAVFEDLLAATECDPGDHFRFQVVRTDDLDDENIGNAVRFRIQAELAGR
jgi:hypothetical protein